MSSTILEKSEEWRKHLLDTSKRNRLVNFKLGRAGGVGLVRLDAAGLWQGSVADEAALTFPWKRERVDLPRDEGDGQEGDLAEDLAGDEDGTARRPGRPDVLALCLGSPRL